MSSSTTTSFHSSQSSPNFHYYSQAGSPPAATYFPTIFSMDSLHYSALETQRPVFRKQQLQQIYTSTRSNSAPPTPISSTMDSLNNNDNIIIQPTTPNTAGNSIQEEEAFTEMKKRLPTANFRFGMASTIFRYDSKDAYNAYACIEEEEEDVNFEEEEEEVEPCLMEQDETRLHRHYHKPNTSLRQQGQLIGRPSCRDGHSMNWYWDGSKKKFLLFGGKHQPLNYRNDFYQLDWETRQWTLLQPHHQISSHLPSSHIESFHYEQFHQHQPQIEFKMPFTKTSNSGLPIPNSYPSGRCNHSCIIHKDRYLILFGGFGQSRYFNDLYFYDLVEKQWFLIQASSSTSKSNVPTPRSEHGMVIISTWNEETKTSEEYLIIYGGYIQQKYLNDMYCFSLQTMEWMPKIKFSYGSITQQPSPRASHTLNVRTRNNKRLAPSLIVFGGDCGKLSNELFEMEWNWNCFSWQRIPVQTGETIPLPRRGHRSVYSAEHDFLFVFGGYNESVGDLNDLFYFDLRNRIWRSITLFTNPFFDEIWMCHPKDTSNFEIWKRSYHQLNILEDKASRMKLLVSYGFDSAKRLNDLIQITVPSVQHQWNIVQLQNNLFACHYFADVEFVFQSNSFKEETCSNV